MNGQGRPKIRLPGGHCSQGKSCWALLARGPEGKCAFRDIHWRMAWQVCLLVCVWFAGGLSLFATPMQVRITWGDGQPLKWEGEISASGATLRGLRPLGMAPTSLLSAQLRQGRVLIQPQLPQAFEGLDLELDAAEQASLTVMLKSSAEGATATTLEIPLQDLAVPGAHVAKVLDADGNRLYVTRTPGDELHVRLLVPELIMAPGETLRMEVTPRFWRTRPSGLMGRYRLLNAAGKVLWSRESAEFPQAEANEATWPVEFAVPTEAGVYELRLEAWQRNQSLPLRAIPDRIFSQRTVQFVVIENQSVPQPEVPPRLAAAKEPGGFQLLEELSAPLRSENWSLSRAGRLLTTVAPGHQGELQTIQDNALGPLFQLEASSSDRSLGNRGTTSAWIAFPVAIGRPGEAHALTVSYPNQRALAIHLAYLEPDERGNWQASPVETGVGQTAWQHVGEAPRLLEHELIVWPKRKEGLVVLATREAASPAIFHSLRWSRLSPLQNANQLLRMPGLNGSAPSLRLPLWDRQAAAVSVPTLLPKLPSQTGITPVSQQGPASAAETTEVEDNATKLQQPSVTSQAIANTGDSTLWSTKEASHVAASNPLHNEDTNPAVAPPQRKLGLGWRSGRARGLGIPLGIPGGRGGVSAPSSKAPQRIEAATEPLNELPGASPAQLESTLSNPVPANLGKVSAGLSASERMAAAWLPRGRLLKRWMPGSENAESGSHLLTLNRPAPLQFDDWKMVDTALERCMQHLEYSGFNTLIVNVLADGASLLPEEVAPATPRWETGVFLPDGSDPVRKDVLELLACHCDLRGVRFVPALVLDRPLPELVGDASANATGGAGVDDQLTGRSSTWVSGRSLLRPEFPRAEYSPLLPRVRAAHVRLMERLVQRYAQHPSFQGVCLQLTPQDQVHLRSLEWGYDDLTLALFVREAGLNTQVLPDALRTKLTDKTLPQRNARRREWLTGASAPPQLKEAWLNWRKRQIQRLYQDLAAVVARGKPGAKLFLAPHELLLADEYLARLRSEPHQALRVDRLLEELGLEGSFLERTPHLCVLRPDFSSPVSSAALQGIANNLKDARDLDTLLQTQAPLAAARMPVPSVLTLAGLPIPGEENAAQTWSLNWSETAGTSCQYFATALARSDLGLLVEGSATAGWGLSPEQQAWIAAYRQLPAEALSSIPLTLDPIIARGGTVAGQTWLYLLNPTPWPAQVRLVGHGTQWRLQAATSSAPAGTITPGATTSEWNGKLGPYQLAVYRLAGPLPKFQAGSASFSPEIATAVRPLLQDTWSKTSRATEPRALVLLGNPDFEQVGSEEGVCPGWTTLPVNAGERERGAAASGEAAFHLRGGPRPVQVLSESFVPPGSGSLNMITHLRTLPNAPPFRLSLLVEDQVSGLVWAEHLGNGTRYALTENWRSYQLPLRSLPVSDEPRLRIRMVLDGPGEVWIDHLQFQDPRLSGSAPLERAGLANLTNGLNEAELQLDAGRPDLAGRFLQSYWPGYLRGAIPAAPLELASELDSDIWSEPQSAPEPAQAAGKPTFSGRLRSLWNWR